MKLGAKPLIILSAVAIALAAIPSTALAAGISPGANRVWIPTTTTTVTTHLPCTQSTEVCEIVSRSTAEGHWAGAQQNAKSALTAASSTTCYSYYYAKWNQNNSAYNLFGVEVWADNFTAEWGYNWCSAYLYKWWHSTYTNAGYFTCGSVWNSGTYWSGSDLYDEESQGFGSLADWCTPTEPSWINNNYSFTTVYGSMGGSTRVDYY